MSTMRKRVIAPLAIALAVAIAPTLSGCFGGIPNPIEGIIEGATGDIIFGASFGTGAEKVFNVTIKVSDGTALESITSQLEGAGFTSDASMGGSTVDGGTGFFSSEAWGVLVVVSKDSEDGWIANYTVTTAAAE